MMYVPSIIVVAREEDKKSRQKEWDDWCNSKIKVEIITLQEANDRKLELPEEYETCYISVDKEARKLIPIDPTANMSRREKRQYDRRHK